MEIANANIIREFGSVNQSVTNVIYTNGALDLYLNTGMLTTSNPNTVVLTIEGIGNIFIWIDQDNKQPFVTTLGYSKSADLTSINTESDTPALIEAKEQIREQIIAWSVM